MSAQHLSSVTDMRVMRDAQYCNLSCDMPHESEKSDHFPLQLDLSCSISTPSADASSTPSQSSTRPQFKYMDSQADAYQQCLTAELLMKERNESGVRHCLEIKQSGVVGMSAAMLVEEETFLPLLGVY